MDFDCTIDTIEILLLQILSSDNQLVANASSQLMLLEQKTEKYLEALVYISLNSRNQDIRIAASSRYFRIMETQVSKYDVSQKILIFNSILSSLHHIITLNRAEDQVVLAFYLSSFKEIIRYINKFDDVVQLQIFSSIQNILLINDVQTSHHLDIILNLAEVTLSKIETKISQNESTIHFRNQMLEFIIIPTINAILKYQLSASSVVSIALQSCQCLHRIISYVQYNNDDQSLDQLANCVVEKLIKVYYIAQNFSITNMLDVNNIKQIVFQIFLRSLITNKNIDESVMCQLTSIVIENLINIQNFDLYRDDQYCQTLFILSERLISQSNDDSDDGLALVKFNYFTSASVIIDSRKEIIQSVLNLIYNSVTMKIKNYSYDFGVDCQQYITSFLAELCIADEKTKQAVSQLIQETSQKLVVINDTEECQVNVALYFILIRCLSKQLDQSQIYHTIGIGFGIMNQIHPLVFNEFVCLIQDTVAKRLVPVDFRSDLPSLQDFQSFSPTIPQEQAIPYIIQYSVQMFDSVQNQEQYRYLCNLMVKFIQLTITGNDVQLRMMNKILIFNTNNYCFHHLDESLQLLKACCYRMPVEMIRSVLINWFDQITPNLANIVDYAQLSLIYEMIQQIVGKQKDTDKLLLIDIVSSFVINSMILLKQESYKLPLKILYGLLNFQNHDEEIFKQSHIQQFSKLFEFLCQNMSPQLLEEAGTTVFILCQLQPQVNEQEILMLIHFLKQLLNSNEVVYSIFSTFFIIQVINSLWSSQNIIQIVISSLNNDILILLENMHQFISNNALQQTTRRIIAYSVTTLFFQLIPFYLMIPDQFNFFGIFLKTTKIQQQLEQYIAIQIWMCQDKDLQAYFRYRNYNLLNRRNSLISLIYLLQVFNSRALHKLFLWQMKENSVYFSKIRNEPPSLDLKDFSEPTQQVLLSLNPCETIYGRDSFFAHFDSSFFSCFLQNSSFLVQGNDVVRYFVNNKDYELALKIAVQNLIEIMKEYQDSFNPDLAQYYQYLLENIEL